MSNPVDTLAKVITGIDATVTRRPAMLALAEWLGKTETAVYNWHSRGIPKAAKWDIRQKLRHSGLSDADYAQALAALDDQVAPSDKDPRVEACA